MTRCIANDEFAIFGAEVTVGHINRDALLALSAQAVGQQRQVGFARALHARQVVLQHRFGVDQQTANQSAFAVIDRTTGDELEC